MRSKSILSPLQRAALFDPPTDVATVERLYTLGPDDLAQVFRRRRSVNRLGYAVQLCYLRRPGRALALGETPSPAVLALLAGQIGCDPGDFTAYAAREPTLREHRAELEAWFGMRAFERGDLRAMVVHGIEVAGSTDRGEQIVAAMLNYLRTARIVLPAASTLERVASIARAQARRAAFAGLIRDLALLQADALDQLIATAEDSRTKLAWVRNGRKAPSASNLKGLLERLDHVRALGIEANRGRRVHTARYAVVARVAAIMTAQHLSRLERRRRLATLVAFAIEAEVMLTYAALGMVEKMVGSLFRRADRTRSERLIGSARHLKETARAYARLGRVLIDARDRGGDPIAAVADRVGWDVLERGVHDAEELTRTGDDGMEEVLERYPAVRRFAPAFLAAFTFRAGRENDPLLSAVDILCTFYARAGRRFPNVCPARS